MKQRDMGCWLAGAGAVLLSAGASVAAEASSTLPPVADQVLARAIFRELIEINTTHEHGSTAAAEAIGRRLLAAGFASRDVVLIAPPDHPGKGNVVVRLHGKGKAAPVLFLGHLDVVEARPEDWSVDPFRLTEKDGWYYGRGTVDMKNGDAQLLESLLRLKREGFVPERDVIAAFTADEEAGGDANGPAFLLKEHRDLIDAQLAVNLDGGGGTSSAGKRLYFNLGTSEKTYLTFTAETTGPGGHGAMPVPDNTIYRLAAGLGRLEAYRFPAQLTATTRASFERLAMLEPGPDSADMKAVAQTPMDAAAAERLSQNPRYNAQLRTTCVPTLISGGQAENALPQRARATIQCRMMPGDSAANVEATLLRILNDPKISLRQDAPPIVSPESPPTAALLEQVSAVVHSMWPGVEIVPRMSGGFSDGRQTRNAGIPTYELGGTWSDVGEARAHGRDERISIQAFDEGVEYTYRLVKAMSQAR